MTNSPIDPAALTRITPAAILDINARMPRRCPTFFKTMHDTIDDYFDDPDAPATPIEHEIISNTLIELRF